MKRALAALLLLSTVSVAGADQQRGRGTGIVSENPPQSQEIFLCGNDQTLENPIPLREGTIVLAGDGRFYKACPSAPIHGNNHREAREQSLIGNAFQSRTATPLERWRAAQAIVRQPKFRKIVVAEVSRTGNNRSLIGTSTDDLLGQLVTAPVSDPACSAVIPIVGPPVDSRRWLPGVLFDMLDSPQPEIQKEAAYALGKHFAMAGRRPEEYDVIFKELTYCVLRQQVLPAPEQLRAELDEVTGLLLEAIGLGAYPNAEQRNTAEAFLIQQAKGTDQRLLGAARGVEALIRGNPRRPILDATRTRLRELAAYGQAAGRSQEREAKGIIRLLAVQSLLTAGETDLTFMQGAAADHDWQVRRLVAGRVDPSNVDHAVMVNAFRADPALQVRYDLVGSFARSVSRTATCRALADFFKDGAPLVVMRALDSLPAKCSDVDQVVPYVIGMADKLDGATSGREQMSWHIPARALTTLSRLKPEEASARLGGAAKNAIWQVRAAAAGVAAAVQAGDTLEILARDEHANVRTAALDGLLRTKNPNLVPLAIDTLKNGLDNQLLMTAARVLRGLPAESKNDATEALLGTLRRLTDQGSDTTRDSRVAILDRLGETMDPARSGDLQTYVSDFDDSVVAAAVKAFTAVVGAPPADAAKRRRYPAQPTERSLGMPMRTAQITTDDGVIDLVLLPDVAPVTVAWFRTLAQTGAYDGKSLHRVAPNFVVQGGSPGANEYSGVTERFLRDEVGPQARHIRGAVGISTRGPDTGDGQIFFDLVDSPRLDRAYTVFAYVTSGMAIVDRMLEGAVIRSVTVK